DASIRSGTPREKTLVPAQQNASGSGLQTVTYQGVQFDVPAGWQVHDLAADPTTCVRFDVHAVYLGTPGADMSCPAHVIGHVDAVLVQPSSADANASAMSGGVGEMTASGLEVQATNGVEASSETTAQLPTAGVSVTLSHGDSDTTAQQILQS